MVTGRATAKVIMSNELHDARNLLVRLKSIYKITLAEGTDFSQDFDQTLNQIKKLIESSFENNQD